jgi:hypothetical protein
MKGRIRKEESSNGRCQVLRDHEQVSDNPLLATGLKARRRSRLTVSGLCILISIRQYGAVKSKDLKKWEDISSEMKFPPITGTERFLKSTPQLQKS